MGGSEYPPAKEPRIQGTSIHVAMGEEKAQWIDAYNEGPILKLCGQRAVL